MLEKVQYWPYLPPLVSGYSAEQSLNGVDQRRFEFQERYAQNSDPNMALQRSNSYDVVIGAAHADNLVPSAYEFASNTAANVSWGLIPAACLAS